MGVRWIKQECHLPMFVVGWNCAAHGLPLSDIVERTRDLWLRHNYQSYTRIQYLWDQYDAKSGYASFQFHARMIQHRYLV